MKQFFEQNEGTITCFHLNEKASLSDTMYTLGGMNIILCKDCGKRIEEQVITNTFKNIVKQSMDEYIKRKSII